MIEAKHTKGPWRVGRPGTVVADEAVPEINGSEETFYYGGHLIAESIAEKNVSLIAAAPDLLEALEEARWLRDHIMGDKKRIDWGNSFDVDFGRMNDAFIKFDVALAKAKGGAA